MKSLFKWTYRLFWTLILVVALVKLYSFATHDFQKEDLVFAFTNRPEWEIPALSNSEQSEISQLLSQEFSYLDRGGQSFAFESADQRIVLKLFRKKFFDPPGLINRLTHARFLERSEEDWENKREEKLNLLFGGYHLAYLHNRKQTALRFIHLTPTQDLPTSSRFRDRLGRLHEWNPNNYVFVLQEKGDLLSSEIIAFLSKKKYNEALTRIKQVFELYRDEYERGMYDQDFGAMHNLGILRDKPFRFDVGQLTAIEEKENFDFPAYMNRIVKRIKKWLLDYSPQEAHTFIPLLEDEYNKFLQ